MKPESRDYLGKARHCIENARAILQAGIPDVAAREAYLAAYHAAEACIFERTGRAAKTHRGVRSQIGRFARDDTRIERDALTFLAQGYDLKAVADYGVGPSIDAISSDDALTALDRAERFVEMVGKMLSDD